MSPPAPDREARRLHALRRYDILDTPPEAAFDRITGLIARLLGVPIALVSLVGDEWQFFKSCYGLDVTETPRDVSFCAHAIESDGVMVVEDAREDPRFAANPLVLGEPFIRFYAGAPLRTADGFNLGTLCAIDHAPRGLGPAEAATLRDLAAMVVDEMELRREVDQRRKAEARARQAHARLEAVTEGVRDVVFQINAAGEFAYLNGAWEELTGFEVGESVGRPFTRFMHEEDRAAAQAGFEAMLRAPGEMPDRYETRCLTASGGSRWVEVRPRILVGEDGRAAGVSGTMTDVTDGRRYVAEREARQRAEELLRLKSALLNNMSHELRTPLTGILGFAEVLAEEAPEPQREFAAIIKQSADRLLGTVGSVLDLAGIEGGTLALCLEPIDVGAETEEAVRPLRARAARKGLALTVKREGAVHARLDRAALRRVLGHLVGNAVKFTECGGVAVEVALEPPHVVVRVRDTGIGIGEPFLPRLFDAFEQASSGLDRSHEGSGLGLAVSKRLVELMGGTIGVASRLGEGATFTLRFPLG